MSNDFAYAIKAPVGILWPTLRMDRVQCLEAFMEHEQLTWQTLRKRGYALIRIGEVKYDKHYSKRS